MKQRYLSKSAKSYLKDACVTPERQAIQSFDQAFAHIDTLVAREVKALAFFVNTQARLGLCCSPIRYVATVSCAGSYDIFVSGDMNNNEKNSVSNQYLTVETA